MAQSEDNKESCVLYSNDCPSFSNLLKTVLTTNSSILRFQGQYEKSQKGSAMSMNPSVPGVQVNLQVESANSSIDISQLSPPVISVQHSATAKQNPPMMLNKDACGLVSPEQESDHNTCPSPIIREIPANDGYSWRKYGQKQVKSSKSSRSYYRCAHSNCHTKKKVQHSDQSGHVIDVVYIGHHNHDPFQNKRNITIEPVSTAKTASVSHADLAPKVDEDSEQSSLQMAESEQHSSSSSNGNIRIKVEEHNSHKLESKKFFTEAEVQENHDAEPRMLKRSKQKSDCSAGVLEANKRSKVVVHAAVDGAIPSDGYRWRKYGQKMVKGNSYLRSYYKCTSAGCPAHKHVERVTDDSTTSTITYVGKHDHDIPLPKKPKVLKTFASDASIYDAHCKKMKRLSQRDSTEQPMDMEGDFMDEKVLELGGLEALESAHTLLSMGIKLSPC